MVFKENIETELLIRYGDGWCGAGGERMRAGRRQPRRGEVVLVRVRSRAVRAAAAVPARCPFPRHSAPGPRTSTNEQR